MPRNCQQWCRVSKRNVVSIRCVPFHVFFVWVSCYCPLLGPTRSRQTRNQLGTPWGRRVFREGPKPFELHPIVLNYVQHVFPGGERKILRGGRSLPWLRAWISRQVLSSCLLHWIVVKNRTTDLTCTMLLCMVGLLTQFCFIQRAVTPGVHLIRNMFNIQY